MTQSHNWKNGQYCALNRGGDSTLPRFIRTQNILRILPGVGLGRTAGSRQPVVANYYDHGDWRCPFE